jgi:simple sugar transport system permease protein
MDEVLIASVLASSVRLATPLILCVARGLLCRTLWRGGSTAWRARCCSPRLRQATGAASGSWALALGAAMAVGVALSMLHGLGLRSYPGDQVVSGVAIDIVAAGLTVVLGIAWFRPGRTEPRRWPGRRADAAAAAAGRRCAGLRAAAGTDRGRGLARSSWRAGLPGLCAWCLQVGWLLFRHPLRPAPPAGGAAKTPDR